MPPQAPQNRNQPNRITSSDGLPEFLSEHFCSFAFTSYDAGQAFFVGVNDGQTRVSFINVGRAMGIAYDGVSIHVAGRMGIHRFSNSIPFKSTSDGFDRLFIPRSFTATGDLDIHEICVSDNRVLFANTRYSCVAALHDQKSFEPVWKPEFVSKLVPEDRCHLNGLYCENGKPRLVTWIGQSDVLTGWRVHRESGGMLYDISSSTIFTNLSMPHSPRARGNDFWYLDSGRGFLKRGREQEIVFCPGFLRGLSFYKGFALVTVSLPRSGIFQGLQLEEELRKRGGEPMCAVLIIDIEKGAIIHWLRIEGNTRELFDCVWLPGVSCPGAMAPGDPALANRIFF